MKVIVRATLTEGYSDAPTGRLNGHWRGEYDLPAVPRAGDFIETGYGDQRVERVWWTRNGEVELHLWTIYTCGDSMEDALLALSSDPEAGGD